MRLQHKDSKHWTVTLRKYELDTLISAASWVLEGRDGRIPRKAREQLKAIVDSHNAECRKLYMESTKSSASHNQEHSSGNVLAS